jgi:hypothetical protein
MVGLRTPEIDLESGTDESLRPVVNSLLILQPNFVVKLLEKFGVESGLIFLRELSRACQSFNLANFPNHWSDPLFQ